MTKKTKGPAEAATSPSQSSNQSPQGSQNMTVDITGDQKTPDATSIVFRADAFVNHSMDELKACFEAFSHARNALTGIVNQPRFSIQEREAYNNAGNTVEEVIEFMNGVETLIYETALAARPATIHARTSRAWLLLRAEASYADDVAQFANLVQSLATDLEIGGVQ